MISIDPNSIQIYPIKPIDGLLGFASLILNHHFYLGNIAIHSRPDGSVRLSYPEKNLPNGKVIHCFHPITKEAGALVLANISKKYYEITRRTDHGT